MLVEFTVETICVCNLWFAFEIHLRLIYRWVNLKHVEFQLYNVLYA